MAESVFAKIPRMRVEKHGIFKGLEKLWKITPVLSAKRSVPFFNYPDLFAKREQEYMEVIRGVLSRGAYIMQRDLVSFEKNLARYLGVKHAIGVADGTMALLMGLRAIGIGKGDEVILPSHTFVGSASSIHHAGATPVLVDCARDHLIDPASAARAITPRTKAIMPVQLNGRTADMDAISALSIDHGLAIIEDSCQALGSNYKGRLAGTFGVVGVFSFYPAKSLGCFGDGGALVTNDDNVALAVRMMRDHGRGADGNVGRWGYNARLDNLQAAILDFKLKTYELEIARRRGIAAMYQQRLGEIPELVLPPGPDRDSDHFDIYQNYEIEAERRDPLREYLAAKGVGTVVQWGGRVIHQFESLGLTADVPYTERMTRRFMLLPMNTALSDDDVKYVCDHIRSFYLDKL